MSTHPRTAAVLAIGDEVLRGEVINANAAFLADQLFEIGLPVKEHRVVSDDAADIRNALASLSSAADVVLVTGGLGPTDDDRTLDVVSALLGVAPTVHEPSLAAMKQGFAARGFELTPNNLRQVRIPTGARPLPNPVGVAPGFAIEIGAAMAFFLPGVPREMQRIFLDHIAPALREGQAASGWPPPAVRTFHIFGMGESHIDHRLAGILPGPDSQQERQQDGQETQQQIAIHYRTSAPENHVKVVIRGADAAHNARTLQGLEGEIRERLGAVIYGVDGDSLPEVLARVLIEAEATLALAESCTGGYAGQLVTSQPGASRFFLGGVVAYSDEIKRALLGVRPETLAAHGAVSEPCAAEMAEGVRQRCGATLGVSITGIAGSSQEGALTPDRAPDSESSTKPVGTVCFGVSGPRGATTVTQHFFGGRERIRRAAAYFALDLARHHWDSTT